MSLASDWCQTKAVISLTLWKHSKGEKRSSLDLTEHFFIIIIIIFRWKNLVEAGGVVDPASPEELEGEHELVNA